MSRYHKNKTSLNLDEATDDGVLGWQWHEQDHMQTVCSAMQTDNTSSLSFLLAGCSSWCPTNSVKALKAETVELNVFRIYQSLVGALSS